MAGCAFGSNPPYGLVRAGPSHHCRRDERNCERLEGSPRVRTLRPSFETLASQAPQDEVSILLRLRLQLVWRIMIRRYASSRWRVAPSAPTRPTPYGSA